MGKGKTLNMISRRRLEQILIEIGIYRINNTFLPYNKKENSSQASKGIKHDIKKTSCKIDDDREAGGWKRGR